MYEAYSKWVQSWRDLPILINQWNNVVRWEKRTYLFLRTSEFLWQEGHTAHATHEEDLDTVSWAIEMYAKIYREYFALPGYIGRKSESEKFAGADATMTYESLMPEGKALQGCTSHDLGQNFSKVFGIKFQDKDGSSKFAWQTSWGFSTRSIGGLVMMHGDDAGLRIPPKLAPVQVVILPIKNEANILDYSKRIAEELKTAGIRVKIDDREDETIGFRINKWEVKGVPLRIETGAREVEGKSLTIVRRDTGEKLEIGAGMPGALVLNLLDEIQVNMLSEAEAFLKENTREAKDYEEFKKIMAKERGFILANWCEGAGCEAKIKEETKASTRCLTKEGEGQAGECVYCKSASKNRWLFAQAY